MSNSGTDSINEIDHIVCCLGETVLCGAKQQSEFRTGNICEECLRLERLDDFCPRSDEGCEAVREGRTSENLSS